MANSPYVALAALALMGSTMPVEAQSQLYEDGDQVFPAAWSRDGSILVTVVKQNVPEMRLLTSGGQVKRSIKGPTPNSWAADIHPSGTRVLVESYQGSVSDLYEIDMSSGTTTRLTATSWNEWHPSWSPDGWSIVFDSDSGGRGPRLAILDGAARAVTRPTKGTRPEQGGRWSPNGKHLAFHRHMGAAGDTNYDVVVMDRSTGRETQITADAGDSSSPAWSPDGRRLAFTSNRAGAYDIYVACADGTRATKLTTGTADKRYPVWSPDGRRIAYQAHGDGIWIVDTTGAPQCPAVVK
jgi:Tol biopolymer transport system component